jgi:hypothetical protein
MSEMLSIMTGKLNGIISINTNPLTNEFCQKMSKSSGICKYCYSIKLMKGLRKNSVDKYQRNSIILSEIMLTKEQIYKMLPKLDTEDIVRLHSHGELINIIHLKNFINIANAFENTIFALWTKRKDLIKKMKNFIPNNLILIYSNPTINSPCGVPSGFHKTFNVFTKDYVKENNITINCGKLKCRDCLNCYTLNNNIHTINELLK